MVYETIKFNDLSKEMLEQLRKGAFMTTKVDDKVNTMTIGWGGINVVWYKDVFVAYVRYSRDTYQMLENGSEFTISVPLNNDLKKELAYCGTVSGRDVDKIKECNLTLVEPREINTPVIKECELHYECKVIYKQAMEPGMVPEDVKKRFYGTHNYHVIYYGEIVDSYLLKGEE
jgi:flavin reductase (DIM6/NTAB) family NADH-FMN oxidoreductase RutF